MTIFSSLFHVYCLVIAKDCFINNNQLLTTLWWKNIGYYDIQHIQDERKSEWFDYSIRDDDDEVSSEENEIFVVEVLINNIIKCADESKDYFFQI